MKFRNIEVDFDIFDADCAERYERALRELQRTAADDHSGEGYADGIRSQCAAIARFFDTTCGSGTSEALFGSRSNIRVGIEAVREFVAEANAQKASFDVLLADVRNDMD